MQKTAREGMSWSDARSRLNPRGNSLGIGAVAGLVVVLRQKWTLQPSPPELSQPGLQSLAVALRGLGLEGNFP